MNSNYKPKSFWKRPEGVTGMIFLTALIAGGGFLFMTALPWIVADTLQIFFTSVEC